MSRTLSVQIAWAAAVLLALGALGAALNRSVPPRPNLRPYVTRTELGLGRAALAQQANAAMAAAVRHAGVQYIGAKILSERLDGDRGTVVLQVTYQDGLKQTTAPFTLIFHRTVWALGQLNPGAPPGMSQ